MIDLQINGYRGIDFNDPGMTDQQLHDACVHLIQDGVAGCLPTVITGEIDHMVACLRQIARGYQNDPVVRQVVWGVHIEGPFLNETPGYIGAHPAHCARIADVDTTKILLEAANGLARIVTLAPERDPQGKVTRFLADQGVVVAAGHTDASLDDLRQGIDQGLSMMTHLGNGCPMLLHRHDNIIQRVLSLADHLWISLIADGAHVPWFAFANYVSRSGPSRTVVVSDAISAAGLGPGAFMLGGRSVQVDDDLVPRAPDKSHFIGSAITMQRAVENLRAQGYHDSLINQWCDLNPRRILTGERPTS